MGKYSEYPVKATPTATDTTLGTDQSDGALPQVNMTLSSIGDALATANKNIISAQRASGNGVDIVDGNSGGVLSLTGLESQSGALSVTYDAPRQTTNFEPNYGVTSTTIARGDAPVAVQANLDAHVADTANPHVVTAAQAGADPAGSSATVQGNLDTHIADAANPHGVTAAQAGADPAGSAATVQSNLDTHTSNTSNPHSVTPTQIGSPDISTEDELAGQMQIAVVAALPGTPDANTIYFVTT